MAKRIQSWEVSDAFWERVNPLIPQPERDKEKSYKRIAGGGRNRFPIAGFLKVSSTFCVQAVNGKPCRRNFMAAPVLSTDISPVG